MAVRKSTKTTFKKKGKSIKKFGLSKIVFYSFLGFLVILLAISAYQFRDVFLYYLGF